MIADILFEKSLSIMATDHWVRKIKIFNDGLQLSFVVFSDLATEDRGLSGNLPIPEASADGCI